MILSHSLFTILRNGVLAFFRYLNRTDKESAMKNTSKRFKGLLGGGLIIVYRFPVISKELPSQH